MDASNVAVESDQGEQVAGRSGLSDVRPSATNLRPGEGVVVSGHDYIRRVNEMVDADPEKYREYAWE